MSLRSVEKIHYLALAAMVLIYTVRLLWLLSFPAGRERQPPSGTGTVRPRRSIWSSWFVIANPAGMESYRRHGFLYAQFALFHLGILAAITLSFVISEAAELLDAVAVRLAFQVLIWAACAVGAIRILRRVGSRYLRAISSPDDYFSLALLTVWFGLAAAAAPFGAPAKQAAGEPLLVAYLGVQTFFLLYVPFSKISHYLYYPFTRYYLGKSLGRRGVYPLERGSA